MSSATSRPNNHGSSQSQLKLKGPTQIVFLRLDPILKALLQEITALKTVFDNNGNVADSAWFPLVDAIVRQLENLATHLQSFGGSSSSPSPESSLFAASLVLLVDYVTLPLTAIFHLQLPQQLLQRIGKTYKNNDDSSERRIQIQQSLLRKLLAAAATAIRVYVEACAGDSADATELPSQAPSRRLSGVYFIKYLLALVSCLPSSAQVEQQQQKQQNAGEENNNLLLWRPNTATPLDDGSELWVSILEAIRC
ncbi:MAG: hypothetical protein SGARI_006520, partial [Bacillariaceae sp.]